VLCQFGDGAANHGTFGETLNLAALWRLPVVLLATNNRSGPSAAPARHSAADDLLRRAEGFGVAGLRCDGMDVVTTYNVVGDALRVARDERRPILVEAMTHRFRGHSAADPQEQRSDEQLAEWRRRDPLATFAGRLTAEGVLSEEERSRLDAETAARVAAAVAFADASPEPAPASLHDDVYAT
jgi:pyruvate dehydrogenase E1 component alpha subunit